MSSNDSLHLKHARTAEQEENMRRILEDGVDPFDWDQLQKYHDRPILRRGAWWLVTENQYPYAGATLHLLLIYRDRVRSPAEVCAEAWPEFGEILAWIQHEYDLSHGALLLRFGDMASTGATVDHLHVHVIVGARNDGSLEQKLKVAVGYRSNA